MSSLNITIPTPHGDVTLPFEQFITLGKYLDQIRAEGKQPVWHPNDCGCCVSVHPEGEHSGWVIGADGGADYVE